MTATPSPLATVSSSPVAISTPEVVASSPQGTEIALRLPAASEHDDPGETRAPRGMSPSEFGWRFE